MMPNPDIDPEARDIRECSNCAHGSRPVAMLMLRCQSKESRHCGELVDLDGFCPRWKGKEGSS